MAGGAERYVMGILVLLSFCLSAYAGAGGTVVRKTQPDRRNWQTVIAESHTPEDVCRAVKGRVTYVRDTIQEWQTGRETWDRGAGDCEDFASCVQDLCREIGLECEIWVFWPAGGGSGHAVATGTRNGTMWVSSNGSYDEVPSFEWIRQLVARMLLCSDEQMKMVQMECGGRIPVKLKAIYGGADSRDWVDEGHDYVDVAHWVDETPDYVDGQNGEEL